MTRLASTREAGVRKGARFSNHNLERTRHLRFLAQVQTGPITECWLWRGYTMQNGYGMYGHRLAHRVAYSYWFDDIPDGATLDHLCAVKNCVNPYHLEPVPLAENIRRGPKGTGNWNKRKTHCKRGHEFTPENTYIHGGKNRQCKKCVQISAERRRLAKRVDQGDR